MDKISKKASDWLKKNGLKETNADPVMAWEMGFWHGVEVVKSIVKELNQKSTNTLKD